jgi:hypothetical protein
MLLDAKRRDGGIALKQLVRVVTLFAIVGLPAGAQAQVGVRVGVNLANLSTDPTPPPPIELETLTGLVAGIFVTVPVNDIVGFQPEALYSRQGSKIDAGAEGTVRTKLDYLQVPLLGRVRTGPHSPLIVLFGPSLGFKMRARLGGPNIPEDLQEGFDDQFKGFDFGLVAGAAVETGPFVLDGRYTWGLTNIVKETVGAEPTSDNAKNRVLSISVGLRF